MAADARDGHRSADRLALLGRPLKKPPAKARPEYVGVDPVYRMSYEPGELARCDLWFPPTEVAVGHGQSRMPPVLVMALGYSRFLSATMIRRGRPGTCSRHVTADQRGRTAPKTLVRDQRGRDRQQGQVHAPDAAVTGIPATRIKLAPVPGPELEGPVQRANGLLGPPTLRRLLPRPRLPRALAKAPKGERRVPDQLGGACRVQVGSNPCSPMGRPARFQLHETVGVIRI